MIAASAIWNFSLAREEKVGEGLGLRADSMRKKITRLALCALLFAHSFPAQAQEPAKVPRIGYLTGSSPRPSPLPILMPMHFDKGCEISVISRGKTFWLSIATWRERRTVTQPY